MPCWSEVRRAPPTRQGQADAAPVEGSCWLEGGGWSRLRCACWAALSRSLQSAESLLRLQPKNAPIHCIKSALCGIFIIIKPGFEGLAEVGGRGGLASAPHTPFGSTFCPYGGPIAAVRGVGWHPEPSAPPRAWRPHGSARIYAARLGRSTLPAHQRATRAG